MTAVAAGGAVDRRVGEIREQVASRAGRLPLRAVCQLRGVQVTSRELGTPHRPRTAMLVPQPAGFNVVIGRSLWEAARERSHGRQRLRFVIAQELGHTFFYRPGAPPRRSRPADRVEEEFCQRFATGLLVPRPAALSVELTPQALHALAAEHDVSYRVAAWAVARARPDLSILNLRWAEHPLRPDQPAMRVAWAASERFVANGESFKSPLADLAPGAHGQLEGLLRLGGRRAPALVSAWRHASSMTAIVQHHEPGCPTRSSPVAHSTPGGQMALF